MKTARQGEIKEAIALAYMQRAIRDGQDKIRVLDLAKDAGVNKNSFYYHFATRQSVAYWIVRRDIASVLEESFDAGLHVFVEADLFPNGKDAFEELPYYARVYEGARMLGQGEFLKQLVLKMRANQDYYRTCFWDEGPEGTMAYLRLLYKPAMEEDVDIIAGGRFLPDPTRAFLAASMLNMNLGIVRDMVCEPAVPDGIFDSQDNPFWNMAAESLNDALRNHPVVNPRFLPENYRVL